MGLIEKKGFPERGMGTREKDEGKLTKIYCINVWNSNKNSLQKERLPLNEQVKEQLRMNSATSLKPLHVHA